MNCTEVLKENVGLNMPKDHQHWVLAILVLLYLVGFFGNTLTLLALPYIRQKYGFEFSVLQTSTAILILHLSFCDLLYIVIGFTHFIHIIIVGRNPFSSLMTQYNVNLCYWVAFFRNLAANADLSTMGAIALCICKHKLCKLCRDAGNPSYHSKHNDPVFGATGIYLTIIIIWLLSFLSIVPDAFNLTGEYMWTDTIYGCDAVYSDHAGYGMIANIVINLIIIVCSYSIVIHQLISDQFNDVGDNQNETNPYTKHIKMFIFLSIAYTICIVPAFTLSWGMFNTQLDQYHQQILQAVTSCLYWSMYGLNFLLYIATSERMRAAYLKFMKDMFCKQRHQETENNTSATWWAGLYELSFGQNEKTISTTDI